MHSGLRAAGRLCVALALLLAWPSAGRAQPPNMDDLVRETQQHWSQQKVHEFVWWMPAEFWEAALRKSGSVPDAAVAEIVGSLRRWTFVAVVHGTMSPLGSFSFASEQELRSSTVVFDAAGKPLQPIAAEELDPDVSNLLGAMKPVLANMLGPLGKSMQFLVFPGRDAKGAPVADATARGRFHVRRGDRDFFFRLPLGALLPKVACKEDGEVFPGNHRYCPFHGGPLSPVP